MGSAPSRQTRTIRISAPLPVTTPNTALRKLPSATPTTNETCLPGEILDATNSIHTLNEDESNEQERQKLVEASERVESFPSPITFQNLTEQIFTQSRNYKVIRDARMSVGTTDLFDKLAPINPDSSDAKITIQIQSSAATLTSKDDDLLATKNLDMATLPPLQPNNPPSSSSIQNEHPTVGTDSNQLITDCSEQSSTHESLDPEHLRSLEIELRELKSLAEEQRMRYERRILKLRNKLKLARAESSVQIFGLQEEIKGALYILPSLSQPAHQPAETSSTNAQLSSDAANSNQVLHQQIETKNQLIKDLSIQLLELKHQLLNHNPTSAPPSRDG
ncbi:hypothetical protein HDU81_000458 [Chytriomyces hyalinus]|nr:hypothetical protein HDU81_000458 [Chytriomyces hyalinus]